MGSVIPGPVVKLVDRRGRPVSGATVRFSVVLGSSSVANASTVTDASGLATAGSWTLGTRTTVNILRVTSDSSPSLDFRVVGIAGPTVKLKLLWGNNQAGLVNSALLTPGVMLQDAYENVVAGAIVNFAGTRGGDPSYVFLGRSDDHGVARPAEWTLGSVAGTYAITVTLGTLPPLVIQATAIDSSSIQAVYEISTIDDRPSPYWGVTQATIALTSTGHFLEAIQYPTSDSRSSGRYVINDAQIELTHYYGYTERGTIDAASLTINREDYYSFIQRWRYTRRR